MVGKNNKEIVSVKIEVEFETKDNVRRLFGDVDNEHSIQLCDGDADLKLLSAGNNLSFDGGVTAELLLSFSVGVASGIVGNLIFTLLCDRVKKLTLNGRRTRITEESITQAIETVKNLVLLSEEKDCNHENSNERK